MSIKISALGELATAPAVGDLLAIVDVSEPLDANKTKKISTQNLLSSVSSTLSGHTTDIGALQAPPKARLTVTTDFSSGTAISDISWENEVFDTNSMWDSAVNAARLYFPTAGLYLISFQVVWSSGTAGSYRHAGLYLNGNTGSLIGGTTIPASAGAVVPLHISSLYQFTAGQYLTAKLQSGEAENVSDCMMTAVRVSN